MEDGSQFELAELLNTGNESMKKITPDRFRLGLITPKLNVASQQLRLKLKVARYRFLTWYPWQVNSNLIPSQCFITGDCLNLARTFLLTLIFALSGFIARPQTLQTLVSFANTNGAIPTGLTPGNDGNFYGLTDSGGNTNLNFGYGYGTVFRLTTNGSLTTLVRFNNTNGASSLAAPTLGKDGNFYGTTFQGGNLNLNFGKGQGTIFRTTTSGILTKLVEFDYTVMGANPTGLTLGKDGNFYGTTEIGGSTGYGTAFQVTTNGTFTKLVDFSYTATGSNPNGLTLGKDGNFYGTASKGGDSGYGTVFQMTPNGTLTTLVSFSGITNGAYPLATLTLGSDGSLYGTTHQGGNLNLNSTRGFGTIFQVSTNGKLTTLVNFNGANGASPTALTLSSDGNFYGLTGSGGDTNLNSGYGYGTVFKLTTNGILTTLVYFNGTNGTGPTGLTLGKDGNLYGTVGAGGTGNFGTVFRLLIPPIPPIPTAGPTLSFVSPTLNQQWNNATFTVTGNAGDNVAVGNVFYSLNSGSWTNATTANSWTNWSGSLALTPGTNTVKAYAVDTSGNRSTTNAVSFEYVVLMPVVAQVYGLGVPNPKWGSLRPNYSSQTLLPVNEESQVTARASRGFALANWTDGAGDILTNGTTLQFTMATNLSLYANFVDIIKPTLRIVTPKAKKKLTSGTITVTGKVADNVAVGTVYCSLNGSAWMVAALTKNSSKWSASVVSIPGNNVVRAFAVDTCGNFSTTNTVAFVCQIVSKSSAVSEDEQTAPAILEAVTAPANGQFALSVIGTEGQIYVVQVSTDLMNWTSVTTNQSPFIFVDTEADKYQQRFYRSFSPP